MAILKGKAASGWVGDGQTLVESVRGAGGALRGRRRQRKINRQSEAEVEQRGAGRDSFLSLFLAGR